MFACPSHGLDLGDVGLMLQGIGGCGCSESMDAQAVDLNPDLFRLGRHHGIDAVGRDAGTGQFAAQCYEQGHLPVRQMKS